MQAQLKTISPEFYALVGAGLLAIYGQVRVLASRSSWGWLSMLIWRVSFAACAIAIVWAPKVDPHWLSLVVVAWLVGATVGIPGLQVGSKKSFYRDPAGQRNRLTT